MSNTTTATIQIYVGTYGKYNNGSIKGEWVDLTEFNSHDEFLEHCATIHSDEVDPEFMFQDCEGIPSALYSECSAKEVYEVISYWNDNLEHFDLAVILEYVAQGNDIDNFEDSYIGEYSSTRDFTDELADEMLHGVPSTVANYFDYQSWHRDVMYDYYTIDNHIFRA